MAKREQAIGKSTGKSKTKMKVYNSREAKKVVRKNGYTYEYSRGDHDYYMKGKQRIVIARNLMSFGKLNEASFFELNETF